MLKIFQARLQQYINWELPVVKAGFRKGKWTRANCQHLLDHKKSIYSASLTTPKPLTCGSQQTGKFLKRWEYQATLPASWENCTQIKKSQSESGSVMSDSLGPHGLYSPWSSLGQNTWVGSFPFSRGSSQPRDWTQISHIAGEFFTSWTTREAQEYWSG